MEWLQVAGTLLRAGLASARTPGIGFVTKVRYTGRDTLSVQVAQTHGVPVRRLHYRLAVFDRITGETVALACGESACTDDGIAAEHGNEVVTSRIWCSLQAAINCCPSNRELQNPWIMELRPQGNAIIPLAVVRHRIRAGCLVSYAARRLRGHV